MIIYNTTFLIPVEKETDFICTLKDNLNILFTDISYKYQLFKLPFQTENPTDQAYALHLLSEKEINEVRIYSEDKIQEIISILKKELQIEILAFSTILDEVMCL